MADDLRQLFLWPTASQVPKQEPVPLHKPDPLLELTEDLLGRRKAWAPIGGATRRTEPSDKLRSWLTEQARHAEHVARVKPARNTIRLSLSDFPRYQQEKRTIGTSTRIVYLIDETPDFIAAFEKTFGKAGPLRRLLDSSRRVFLYVTNSVESGGRAFSGDPFTGQVTAYIKIFATDVYNQKTHNAVLYYPNQLYSQIFEANGRVRENKGTKMLHELADALIFAGGVTINPKDWSILV